jgi:hypothetical protein
VASEKALAQKKKWALTHRTRPPCFEQAVNYTERVSEKQPESAGILPACDWSRLNPAVIFFPAYHWRFSGRDTE